MSAQPIPYSPFPVGHFFIHENLNNTLMRNKWQRHSNCYIIRPMNAKDYTATVPEYAKRWKLNIQTVRRFIREGRLHAVKVGRCYFLDPDVIPDKDTNNTNE